MSKQPKKKLRILVIGAGVTGSMTIERMRSGKSDMPGIPVIAVDDVREKIGTLVSGIKIVGTCDEIPHTVNIKELDIVQIVFAIPSATREQCARIYDICLKADVRILAVPPLLLGTQVEKVKRVPIKQVGATELLSRPEIMFDANEAVGLISDKIVLVTGGGGSIGSEICRQVSKMKPARVIIFDIYENTAYEFFCEFWDEFGAAAYEKFIVEIGSICDEECLCDLFNAYPRRRCFARRRISTFRLWSTTRARPCSTTCSVP